MFRDTILVWFFIENVGCDFGDVLYLSSRIPDVFLDID
jgi:hypothetical protein